MNKNTASNRNIVIINKKKNRNMSTDIVFATTDYKDGWMPPSPVVTSPKLSPRNATKTTPMTTPTRATAATAAVTPAATPAAATRASLRLRGGAKKWKAKSKSTLSNNNKNKNKNNKNECHEHDEHDEYDHDEQDDDEQDDTDWQLRVAVDDLLREHHDAIPLPDVKRPCTVHHRDSFSTLVTRESEDPDARFQLECTYDDTDDDDNDDDDNGDDDNGDDDNDNEDANNSNNNKKKKKNNNHKSRSQNTGLKAPSEISFPSLHGVMDWNLNDNHSHNHTNNDTNNDQDPNPDWFDSWWGPLDLGEPVEDGYGDNDLDDIVFVLGEGEVVSRSGSMEVVRNIASRLAAVKQPSQSPSPPRQAAEGSSRFRAKRRARSPERSPAPARSPARSPATEPPQNKHRGRGTAANPIDIDIAIAIDVDADADDDSPVPPPIRRKHLLRQPSLGNLSADLPPPLRHFTRFEI